MKASSKTILTVGCAVAALAAGALWLAAADDAPPPGSLVDRSFLAEVLRAAPATPAVAPTPAPTSAPAVPPPNDDVARRRYRKKLRKAYAATTPALHVAAAPRGREVLREELVALRSGPGAFARALAGADPLAPPPERFELTMFGKSYPVVVGRHAPESADAGSMSGAIAGAPGSHALLGYDGEATAGTLYVPGDGLYRIRYAGNGLHRVAELDPAAMPHCEGSPLPPGAVTGAAPNVPASSAAAARSGSASRARLAEAFGDEPEVLSANEPASTSSPAAAGDAPAAAGDTAPPVALADATTVDVLVVYTPASAAANGGTAGVNALINASVASANTAHANSGTGVVLRLMGTAQVSYTESGALATDLPRLAGTSDGYMDNVHALRESYKADVVSLFVTSASDAAGIGYLWTPGGAAGFASYAFNVVVDDYADSNLTFAHEVGHNLGCGHAASDGGGGAYAASHGWRFTAGVGGTTYRTVMAYAPGIRVPYFSNPSVTYLGVATGVSGSADNTAGIVSSRAAVAALKSGLTAAEQAWVPIASGDFDGDGQTDLVWRNTQTGRVVVWLMNGTTRLGSTVLWSGDAAWVPIAAADFNADGKPDLVWRNSATGRVIIWLMNGVTTTSTVTVWSGDPAWVPLVAGNLDNDGKPDLVWRNSTTGRVIVWFLSGTTTTSTATLWSGDGAWAPVAMADFDADGKSDLVWRNSTTGRVIVWYMNGVAQTGSGVLWSGAATWVPRVSATLAGDAQADLVWRNSADGRVIVWTMSGVNAAGTTAIWQ